ncbi:hypothetical protein CVIRNUC_007447 [Coccomyxa viridis]|uniref:RRM domain-containing protein n=1 Tax=Coccomyxa viridis TaxID=1274662 RepID=A0AAV1IED6_9CHLO|nr:hypothetical protein CVIRNUC_007447 [Coccomyxa viridis]
MAAAKDEPDQDVLDQDEPSSTGTEQTDDGIKLFLGGLSWSLSEDQVREYFETKYGRVKEVVIMRDKYTSRPRGFGFLTLSDEEAATQICQDTHTLDGRQIDAKRSLPQSQKPKLRKLFVGGLAPETTEDDFREYFGQFGEITEAQIMQDHTSGRSRGFGFITYDEEGAIEKVFAQGRMHELAGKSVEVKRATPKGTGPSLGRGLIWRGYDQRADRAALEHAGYAAHGAWPGHGLGAGMLTGYMGRGTPYEGFYGPMQGMQQMGAYRHNPAAAYSYGMYHSMQHQGRGH